MIDELAAPRGISAYGEAGKQAYILRNDRFCLAVGVFAGRPLTLHLGAPIAGEDALALLDDLAAAAAPYSQAVVAPAEGGFPEHAPGRLPLEYPEPEGGDFRTPAFIARPAAAHAPTPGGRSAAGRPGPAMDLRLAGSRIYEGRPPLGGLVESRAQAGTTTLELRLADAVGGLELELSYTVLPSVILRSAKARANGPAGLRFERLMSLSMDLYSFAEPEYLHFPGAWARERFAERGPLPRGSLSLGSRRGSSGHAQWPGLVVGQAGCGQDAGRCLGLSLVYSGDWNILAERDEEGCLRLQAGLHPELAALELAPGEEFTTPEAVLAWSDAGLNGLSAAFHRYVRESLCPPAWRGRERPVLANNWEATYFDFDRPTILGLAEKAAELGVELFVLDDGWFGSRDSDRRGLGDWEPNRAKLGGSLGELADAVRAKGLRFGLWVEPEMVNPDSELYRLHPDWALAQPGRMSGLSRNQLVLDLSRPEVVDHVASVIVAAIAEAKAEYVKWDMNRPHSHAGCDRVAWMKGFYELARRVSAAFPDTLFEGCAGGGGRMDYGLLSFFPQYWASDNSDALSRLDIQEGTGYFIPPEYVGAHVSATPNHQTGRVSTLAERHRVAFGGNLGYELDLRALPDDEADEIRARLAWYKAWRAVLHDGARLRLGPADAGPGGEDGLGWVSIAHDGSRAVAYYAVRRYRPAARPFAVRLKGLEPAARYLVREDGTGPGRELSGRRLMAHGLYLAPACLGDPAGMLWSLERLGR